MSEVSAQDQNGVGRRRFLSGVGATSAVALGGLGATRAAAASGRGSGRDNTGHLRFGANYTPSKSWWHTWIDFDSASVRRDLQQISGLGLDHVRVFCTWPIFQPARTLISEQSTDRLLELLDLADTADLDVEVDVLQGHISGFEFFPSWTVTNNERDLFTNPDVLHAQRALFRSLGERLRDHPRFLGFNLGNEMNLLVDEENTSAEQITHWTDTLLAECRNVAPQALHTHCEYDAAFFSEGHPFTPELIAHSGALSTVHSWVFGGAAQQHGGLGTGSVHFAEYLVELVKAYHSDTERPVWVQEVGAPLIDQEGTVLVPADDVPQFTEATVRNALDCSHVWGVTWWCSHDVNPRLPDYTKLEYSLGLLDNDGKPKPVGRKFAELAAEFRAEPPRPQPRSTGLVFAGDRDAAGPRGEYFNAYMRAVDKGLRPAVVLESASGDQDYLNRRGITELVRTDEV